MAPSGVAAHPVVKRDTIYKWIVRKGLPAHKVGRLWRFRKPEVDAWARSGSAAPDNSDGRASGR